MTKTTKVPLVTELISIDQAASYAKFSVAHMRRLVRNGDITGWKLGRDWFTSQAAVEGFQSAKPA